MFNEDELMFLRSLTEEHWDIVRNKAMETMSEEEFDEFCRKVGVDPDDE
ncbi:hypothetical protein YOLOSWAG_210 [Erwinia phage vB_EamM_Yoloswag]|uniref:Uncharacterized protein n=1 Tax=Erwinia phage vB_EamM_Yoloswag TaxID=1958956 RepID=A0A1S6L3D0_9CAUD|nr:hypothetical protein HOR66_gp210 [Erwinia phage vB_EamM_Yoloswag]AQT28688.1 hypothetical protein YOLOSWAG_210 [Erwinia phage vB_EamM_Yoloswag]